MMDHRLDRREPIETPVRLQSPYGLPAAHQAPPQPTSSHSLQAPIFQTRIVPNSVSKKTGAAPRSEFTLKLTGAVVAMIGLRLEVS
jgi:hypothetical protein